MSLQEQYFLSMLNGEKKYEYRKKYRKEKTKAFIYISKTKKSICALIEFDEPIFGTSEFISAISEKETPGNYEVMLEYLGKDKTGYAIPIKKIYFINDIEYLSLKKNFPGFVAPQSYHLLNQESELRKYLEELEVKNFIR